MSSHCYTCDENTMPTVYFTERKQEIVKVKRAYKEKVSARIQDWHIHILYVLVQILL
jgi:hypothetical protein